MSQDLAWFTARGTLLGLWESRYGDASFRDNEAALKHGFAAARDFAPLDWDDLIADRLAAAWPGDWERDKIFVRRGWEMAQDTALCQRLQRVS